MERQGDCGDHLGRHSRRHAQDGVDEGWAWDGRPGAWAVGGSETENKEQSCVRSMAFAPLDGGLDHRLRA